MARERDPLRDWHREKQRGRESNWELIRPNQLLQQTAHARQGSSSHNVKPA
jgi:hypothetical protein